MGALQRWTNALRFEVLLPSGTRVRGALPNVNDLVIRNALPQDLRAAVASFADPKIVDKALEGDPAYERDFLRWCYLLAARAVTAVFDEDAGEWESASLTPEQFEGIPFEDRYALVAIVMRTRSPEAITAATRVARGEVGEQEAEAIEEGEAAATVDGWSSFRHELGSPVGGDDGGAVRDAPVDAPDDHGPGSGAARGRGRRAAAGVPADG